LRFLIFSDFQIYSASPLPLKRLAGFQTLNPPHTLLHEVLKFNSPTLDFEKRREEVNEFVLKAFSKSTNNQHL